MLVALDSRVYVTSARQASVVSEIVFKIGDLDLDGGGVSGNALDVLHVRLAGAARQTVNRP